MDAETIEEQHVIRTTGVDEKGDVINAHNTVGLAVMEQQELIPTTGERKSTTSWEYWTYCIFCGYSWVMRLTLVRLFAQWWW